MLAENWKEVGIARLDFETHLRNELVLPDIELSESRLYMVPLDLSLSNKGKILNLEYAKNLITLDPKYKLTQKEQFIFEAKNAVKSFKGWIPDQFAGKFQETNKTLYLNFFYHAAYFSVRDFCLNPDIRASYPDINADYEMAIYNKNGCDGMGHILALIDKEGRPSQIECLNAVGKTNAQIIQSEFLRLGNWVPAIHQGKKVNSQIAITVYT